MLAFSPALGYIREPFGVSHRPGTLDVRFPHWFPYICAENQEGYLRPVEDMLSFRFGASAALRAVRNPRDLALAAYDFREFSRYRRRGARPLLKDPIAVLSVEWLSDTFGMQPIVLVRHPAAFASSLIRYGWTHPFDDFLQQPLLMRDLLSPFEEEIASFAHSEREAKAEKRSDVGRDAVKQGRQRPEHQDVGGDDEEHAPDHGTFAQPRRRILELVQARASRDEAIDGPAREAEQPQLLARGRIDGEPVGVVRIALRAAHLFGIAVPPDRAHIR